MADRAIIRQPREGTYMIYILYCFTRSVAVSRITTIYTCQYPRYWDKRLINSKSFAALQSPWEHQLMPMTLILSKP